MALNNFEPSLKKVLVHEGGKVDHPKDPGGRTAYGVTQRVYDGFRRNMGLPARDVWMISETERSAIYRNQYWAAVKADRLPLGVDYVVFDGAVNSGPKQSALWLQRALGVKADGVIGEATLAAAAAYEDHDLLIARILDQREAFLKALKTWKTFGKGWGRRIATVLQAGQAQATGSVSMPVFAFIPGADAKALEEDVQKAPSQLTGAAIITAGLGVPQIVGGLAKVGEQLPALNDAVGKLKGELVAQVGILPMLQPVIDHLTMVGSVLAVLGVAYTVYGKIRAAVLSQAVGAPAA